MKSGLAHGVGFIYVITFLFILSLVSPACTNRKEESVSTNRMVELTVLFSSDLLGKIRSCGCSVEDMGGLGRRATYIENVRSNVRNLIVVDAGDAFSVDLAFSRDEAELTFSAFDLMEMDAFTPGEIEFIYGLERLKEMAAGVDFDLLAANVVDAVTGELVLGPAYTIKELEGGLKVGITGVLDDTVRFPSYIDRSSFKLLPVEQTIRMILPDLKEKADFIILLSHMGLAKSRELVEKINGFDLVVVGHGKPVVKRTEKIGDTIVLATGGEGQYIGRFDLFLTGSGDFSSGRMRIVPLGDDIKIHEGVKELFRSYGVELTEKERSKK